MYVINETTKIVNIWADNEINRQRLASGKYGVVEYTGEVEEGYDGILYAKGQAPIEPEKTYIELRAEEYPSISEQLDMQYWDQVNGTSVWSDSIKAIKEKYPKD